MDSIHNTIQYYLVLHGMIPDHSIESVLSQHQHVDTNVEDMIVVSYMFYTITG